MRELIREMTKDELALAMSWANNEGWNTGQHDYKAYYELDKQGFLLLLLDNKPIGSISLVRYSETFAFIGLFIVLPEYRCQGYGEKLWQAAIERLNRLDSIGLYAVPQQVSRYQCRGFFKDHGNHRWQMNESKLRNILHLIDDKQDPHAAYEKLVRYDAKLWGASREPFFNEILGQPNSYAFVTFHPETKKVNGYGIIRACSTKGFRIGPIYSNDPESAKTLTEILIAQIPFGSQVIFDIPEKNKFSSLFAEYFELDRVKSVDTYAMFKGRPHNGGEEQCYGVASLEIG